jgi:hypothetical protein
MTVAKETSVLQATWDSQMGRQRHRTCRTHIFIQKKGMRAMNYVHIVLYIRETYRQLRALSLLVTGCHT